MAGFENDTMYADNVDFTGSTTPAPTVTTDGQLLIGSTVAPNIRVGTLVAGANISITPGAGTITIAATGGGAGTVSGLTPDAFTGPGTSPVLPNGGGNIIVTGAQVASGVVGTNVIRTDSLAANTMTIEIQRATSAAVSTPADNGVAHFDSGVFTVGAGGFVSLPGGGVPPAQKFNVDANTGPGTDPVVPSALGVVNITGAQVAAGTVGANVIRTDSLAVNTITIEVQRATTAAASTLADNGVSHYDSAIFTVGAQGFVSLVGGAVPPAQKFNVDNNTFPGTDPVVADGSGVINFSGNQVGAGTITTGVRTNSIAANSMTVEVQRASAVAGTDVTKNGIAHFNNAEFSVNADGFVSLVGASGRSAFLAYLASNVVNATGNNVTFQLGNTTPLTEVYDTNGDFTTAGVFTAPITGKYAFSLGIRIGNIGSGHTIGYAVLITNNGRYDACTSNPFVIQTTSGFVNYNASFEVDMTAGNTATASVTVETGAQTVWVLSNFRDTFFSGHFIS